jgi:hypothetical protein
MRQKRWLILHIETKCNSRDSGSVVGDPEITPVLPLWSYFSIGGDPTGTLKVAAETFD